MFGLQGRFDDLLLPKNFPRLAVQAKQNSFLSLERRDREDPVLPNNRRSVTDARQSGFPDEVAAAAPVDGNVFFQTGAVEPQPAPAGPILGASGQWPSESQ